MGPGRAVRFAGATAGLPDGRIPVVLADQQPTVGWTRYEAPQAGSYLADEAVGGASRSPTATTPGANTSRRNGKAGRPARSDFIGL